MPCATNIGTSAGSPVLLPSVPVSAGAPDSLVSAVAVVVAASVVGGVVVPEGSLLVAGLPVLDSDPAPPVGPGAPAHAQPSRTGPRVRFTNRE